jgi:hypothetical protein
MSRTQFDGLELDMESTRGDKLQKVQIHMNWIWLVEFVVVIVKIRPTCADEQSSYIATM